jgi:hypothetical protein
VVIILSSAAPSSASSLLRALAPNFDAACLRARTCCISLSFLALTLISLEVLSPALPPDSSVVLAPSSLETEFPLRRDLDLDLDLDFFNLGEVALCNGGDSRVGDNSPPLGGAGNPGVSGNAGKLRAGGGPGRGGGGRRLRLLASHASMSMNSSPVL